MISKSYSIMCSACTFSEGLFSQTLQECKEEVKNTGWIVYKKEWLCATCAEKAQSQNLKNKKTR